MADQSDVRRIALALPQTREAHDHFSFSVANKGKQKNFVWAWNERVEPKKPRVPRADVVAVRVIDRMDKEALLSSEGDIAAGFFGARSAAVAASPCGRKR